MGVDNSRLAAQAGISLTTAENQVELLGKRAGEMIVDMIENRSRPASVELSPRLIIRKSVRTAYQA